MARWRVDIIGKRLQHLGTVEASNEQKAVEIAIEELAVRPALRSKIVVTKVKE
jgi:1,2-phenylacetyl-CoA epoxidase PaaB subunit